MKLRVANKVVNAIETTREGAYRKGTIRAALTAVETCAGSKRRDAWLLPRLRLATAEYIVPLMMKRGDYRAAFQLLMDREEIGDPVEEFE